MADTPILVNVCFCDSLLLHLCSCWQQLLLLQAYNQGEEDLYADCGHEVRADDQHDQNTMRRMSSMMTVMSDERCS